MNENMARLMELINETNKCIDNLKTETDGLRKEYLDNRQAQFEKMAYDLREFCKVIKNLNSDVYVMTNAKTKYNPNKKYCLRISVVDVCVYGEDMRTYLGHIDIKEGSLYKDHRRWCSNCSYDLDTIIDAWDRDEFERRFIIKVQMVMKAKAENANKEYEKAKEALR